MVISEFSGSETTAVIGLILNIQRQEYGLDITAQDQPDLATIATFYQVNNDNFWVAKLDGCVVGCIALLDIGGGDAALRKMFVKAEYRGSEYNIAYKLLVALLDWASAHGLRCIYLGTVDRFKAAHRFYEKNDFQLIRSSALPSGFPRVKVDNVFYVRKL